MKMLKISNRISIPENEIDICAVRSSGPGGQNVNKVSTAIHLRFDITASSLPEFYKQRLLMLKDQRLTKEGVLVIKAGKHRTREGNRKEALERLRGTIRDAAAPRKKRRPTRPTAGSQSRRLERKTRRGRLKALRRKPRPME